MSTANPMPGGKDGIRVAHPILRAGLMLPTAPPLSIPSACYFGLAERLLIRVRFGLTNQVAAQLFASRQNLPGLLTTFRRCRAMLHGILGRGKIAVAASRKRIRR